MNDGNKTKEQLITASVTSVGGKPIIQGIFRDITGRRGAEEALRASEEKYRLLVENANQAIVVAQDGMLRFVNPKATETTGYSTDELTSMPFMELIHPDDREMAVERHIKRLKGKEVPHLYPLRIIDKEGNTKWLEINGVLINWDGRPATLNFLSDITERKQAEKQLRESEEKYRDIFENVSDFLYFHDLDGYFTETNLAFMTKYGYSEDDLDNLNGRDLIPERYKHQFEDYLRRVREDGKAEGLMRVMTKDGRERVVEYRNSLVYDSTGPIGVRGSARDITERKQAEEKLRESEERYRSFVQNFQGVAFRGKMDFRPLFFHGAVEEITGYTEEEWTSGKLRWNQIIHPDDLSLLSDSIKKMSSSPNYSDQKEYRIIRKDGETRWVHEMVQNICDQTGKPEFVQGAIYDITERKRLEQQLLWAQKMETVGRLAGGVAHDFNNMLTTITGYGELGMMRLHPSDRMHSDLQEILKASQKAAKLTQQLLAFSRRQIIMPKVINPNDILLDIDKMLRRLIGEDIELLTLLADDLGRVKVDPGQLEQVIVNLAVNARDAMPQGGKLTLETANVTLDEGYVSRHIAVTPGDYVILAASDTGVGMTEEVKEYLFEPFFTTKEVGKGTGLGLATCYGIVKQYGGNIWVYTELGKGSTFKIYLPRVEEELDAPPMRDESGYLPQGTETVLVVEDELSVRNITARTLREQGYTILEAANGEEALLLAQEHKGSQIHLLLTDVIMPQMNGKTLAEKLRAMRPGAKVLFFSGYTDDAIVHHGILDHGVAFLQKHFSPRISSYLGREKGRPTV